MTDESVFRTFFRTLFPEGSLVPNDPDCKPKQSLKKDGSMEIDFSVKSFGVKYFVRLISMIDGNVKLYFCGKELPQNSDKFKFIINEISTEYMWLNMTKKVDGMPTSVATACYLVDTGRLLKRCDFPSTISTNNNFNLQEIIDDAVAQAKQYNNKYASILFHVPGHVFSGHIDVTKYKEGQKLTPDVFAIRDTSGSVMNNYNKYPEFCEQIKNVIDKNHSIEEYELCKDSSYEEDPLRNKLSMASQFDYKCANNARLTCQIMDSEKRDLTEIRNNSLLFVKDSIIGNFDLYIKAFNKKNKVIPQGIIDNIRMLCKVVLK